jgi:acyl-lipid omega-6 desaturase (Delta-12 desaturase)
LQIETNSSAAQDLRAQVMEIYSHCKGNMTADDRQAWGQVVSTSLVFFPLVLVMLWLKPLENYFAFLLALPLGALLTRFFALQHDCGHGSFYSSKRMNEGLGQLLSMLTFTPYNQWRNSHAVHHAGSGNLERRGIGDVETMTVAEYHGLTTAGKWRYRIMRHPFVALLVGPPIYFLILQRWAFYKHTRETKCSTGVIVHNLALITFYGALCWLLGTANVFAVALPTAFIGSWIGGWLFFVQHQFEEAHWQGGDEWDMKIAALKGSSHLQLPAVLNWVTCDIGLHHIHHLSSRIPNYKLRACMAGSKALQNIAPKLTFWSAMKSVHLGLWDEGTKRLISFGEYRRMMLVTP